MTDDMNNDDLSLITDEERDEAERLRVALERGQGDAPSSALESAALLAYARDGGVLAGDRADAILDQVFDEARPKRPQAASSSRWSWVRFLVPAVAAAALIAMVFWPKPPVTASLPTPSAGLLEAQARVAAGGATTELRPAMREYRSALHSALEDAYAP